MHSIVLKSVYSCPTDATPSGIQLPQQPHRWTLAWHQAETLQALRDPDTDVVINTAMTGDGKSLAAYLSVLQDQQRYAMGLYPTHALASDQEAQVRRYIEQFQPVSQPRVHRLSGPELEVYAEAEGLRKSSAIALCRHISLHMDQNLAFTVVANPTRRQLLTLLLIAQGCISLVFRRLSPFSAI